MVTIRHADLISMDTKTFVKEVIAEIDCDTLDEVPTVDGLDGYILRQGSVVDVIKEGKLLKLSGDGKWYDHTGAVVKEG